MVTCVGSFFFFLSYEAYKKWKRVNVFDCFVYFRVVSSGRVNVFVWFTVEG